MLLFLYKKVIVMISWNELRITPDNRYFIIDVSIEDDTYFNDINIENIIIDTQDTYIQNGPSNNPIYKYKEDLTELKEKHIRLILTVEELNSSLCGNMFFVYIITTGTLAEDTPCGFAYNNNNNNMQTVVNLYPFYREAMYYIRELGNCCSIPKKFIDLILRMKSVELCIRTGNYTQAIKYWNKFFSEYNCENINYNCGCNG